jgi:hypothetical protein
MYLHFKAIFKSAALVIFCVSLCGDVYPQSIQSSEHRVWTDISGEDCETTQMVLDFAAVDAGKDKSIIIIARLGSKERSRQLNRRRLSLPANYLVKTRGFSEKRIVTAEGARAGRVGQVEIYVGGELHTVLKMKRNQDFTTGCVPAG